MSVMTSEMLCQGLADLVQNIPRPYLFQHPRPTKAKLLGFDTSLYAQSH
ncbi:hypothetical protein Plhal304r1_c004g0015341 [Plasmopara halstedii]